MTIRCPMLQDEFTGSDASVVCRKHIARQRGIQCPRATDRYTKVKASCFDIGRLVRPDRAGHYTAEEARMVLLPETDVAGSGEVNAEVKTEVKA